MDGNIEIFRFIDESRLRTDEYFSSLCEQALEKNLLSDADIERIRNELYLLVRQVCASIAEKGSSSLRIETAEEISDSIMFTISVKLKHCNGADEAVKFLQKRKISDLFEEGKKLVSDMVLNTRAKWTVLQGQLFKTQSNSYNKAVDEVKLFFEKYDYRCFAKRDIISFDYPIYNETQKLNGVEFIEAWIDAFTLENNFLKKFDPDDVHALLSIYDKVQGYETNAIPTYVQAPMNIYLYVLACSLALIICGKNPLSLELFGSDFEKLETKFYGKEYRDIFVFLYDAAEKLIFELSLDDEADYLRHSISKLSTEISIYYKYNLKAVFLCESNVMTNEKFRMESMPQMKNSELRFILSQISLHRNADEIAKLIGENVKNEEDFEDIISGAMLSEKEIILCLEKLENPALILFLKKYISKTSFERNEKKIYSAVMKYLRSRPLWEQEDIKRVIAMLE